MCGQGKWVGAVPGERSTRSYLLTHTARPNRTPLLPTPAPPHAPQVHWFSIMNSLLVVLVMASVVAMILFRTVRRDLAKYEALVVEGGSSLDMKDESGACEGPPCCLYREGGGTKEGEAVECEALVGGGAAAPSACG